jgi:hypothetical protein
MATQDALAPEIHFWFSEMANSLSQYLPALFRDANSIVLKDNVTSDELHMTENQRRDAEKRGQQGK